MAPSEQIIRPLPEAIIRRRLGCRQSAPDLASENPGPVAVTRDVPGCLARGGRVVRVRLESELRGRLAAAEAMARGRFSDKARSAAAAREGRRKEAVQLGLRVFARDVPLPDVLVELEEPDGRHVVHASEMASATAVHPEPRSFNSALRRMRAI